MTDIIEFHVLAAVKAERERILAALELASFDGWVSARTVELIVRGDET